MATKGGVETRVVENAGTDGCVPAFSTTPFHPPEKGW